MSNLIIDIGNTALKAAWADGVILGKTFRYQGEKMSDFIMSLVSKEKPDVMIKRIEAVMAGSFEKAVERFASLHSIRDARIPDKGVKL